MSRLFRGSRTLLQAMALASVLALSGLGASASPTLANGVSKPAQPLAFRQICPNIRDYNFPYTSFKALTSTYYRYASDYGYYYEMGKYDQWQWFFGWSDFGPVSPDYYCGAV